MEKFCNKGTNPFLNIVINLKSAIVWNIQITYSICKITDNYSTQSNWKKSESQANSGDPKDIAEYA